MLDALKHHWSEYLMEAAELGIFMVSACVFATILEYPASPARQGVADPFLRRILMGLAMGLTAVGLIYSPWGKQSEAHLNPSVTLTFFRLGKVKPWDALFYIVAQFVGGIAGVLVAAAVLGNLIAHPSVANGRVFFDATRWKKPNYGGPDGLKVDRKGNLFAARPGGISVFAPDGTHLGSIETGVATSNVAWGMTARSSILPPIRPSIASGSARKE